MFVGREPAYCVGGKRPEGFYVREGEEATVCYPTAVAWLVGDELRSGLGVDAIAGNDEVGGYGGAVFESDSYFIGSGILLGRKLVLNCF